MQVRFPDFLIVAGQPFSVIEASSAARTKYLTHRLPYVRMGERCADSIVLFVVAY